MTIRTMIRCWFGDTLRLGASPPNLPFIFYSAHKSRRFSARSAFIAFEKRFYNLFWGAKVTVQMRVLSAPTFFSIKK